MRCGSTLADQPAPEQGPTALYDDPKVPPPVPRCSLGPKALCGFGVRAEGGRVRKGYEMGRLDDRVASVTGVAGGYVAR
ncbi:hypothetical protein GCM10010522_25280 [Kribbella solani]